MSSTQKRPNLLDQWFFVQKVVSDPKLDTLYGEEAIAYEQEMQLRRMNAAWLEYWNEDDEDYEHKEWPLDYVSPWQYTARPSAGCPRPWARSGMSA